MRRLLMILALLLVAAIPARAATDPSPIEARAWLLMDYATGRVLIQHEGDTVLPIASTTKIMTAILALESGDLSAVVKAGQRPYDTGGSTIFLEVGEEQTLENLLYALMLESANDAAVAIAEHLAGTEEQFATWMNEKARALGATRTHFVNSHGLHDPEHYATAHDLALIARYAMQNPTFRQIIAVEEKEIPGAPGNPPRRLINHNRLLGYYEGANGVKNGFTEEAGLANVASARRGQTEFIAVVLGAQVRLWTSSMALLDFGFERYETRRIAEKGQPLQPFHLPGVGMMEAQLEADLIATVERGLTSVTAIQVEPLPDLQPPVAAGDPVGWVRYLLDGREVGRTRAVASKAVGRPATVEPSPATERRPASAPPELWVVAWLAGSLALTLHLNRFRLTKEDFTRGAA